MARIHVTRSRNLGKNKDISLPAQILKSICIFNQINFSSFLPYPRKHRKSVNANTPRDKCKVKYCDIDMAVRLCLQEGTSCHVSKADMKSAFRILGIKKKHWRYLILKAKKLGDIIDRWWYFVNTFMQICSPINFPINKEKTCWPTTKLVFLGLLLDTVNQLILLPQEKVMAGRRLLVRFLNKKKITLRELQQLCGFLNFLGHAIVPGRAFIRRLYVLTSAKAEKLQPHHHLKILQEMKLDMYVWFQFLHHPTAFARPFIDMTVTLSATQIGLASDALKNPELGVGGVCRSNWFSQQWEPRYISNLDPSIEYLELFGVLCAVMLWIDRFRNQRIVLLCDNQSVVQMINSSSSTCRNCMVLIRLLVLKGMTENVQIFAKHIKGVNNYFSDSLSRLHLARFRRLQVQHDRFFDNQPTELLQQIWPASNLWLPK